MAGGLVLLPHCKNNVGIVVVVVPLMFKVPVPVLLPKVTVARFNVEFVEILGWYEDNKLFVVDCV